MKEMSYEACQLVDAGREAFRPTESDRARLMAAITGAATLSVGMAAAAGAQRSLGGIVSVAHATRLLAIALPLTAAGAYFWHTTGESPAPVRPPAPLARPAMVVPKRTVPVPVAPVAEPDVVEQPREPSPPVAPERSGSVVGETAKPGNEIRQEVALLSKAQAALSRGRPQEALEALSEHATRFPRGALTEERAATRARTLCALGRNQEAEAELKRIEKLNPASAYLARARESCGLR